MALGGGKRFRFRFCPNELSEMKSLYEGGESVHHIAKVVQTSVATIYATSNKHGWKRHGRNNYGRKYKMESRLRDAIQLAWHSGRRLKDIASKLNVDTRTAKKVCYQEFGPRDPEGWRKRYFEERDATLLKMWNAGCDLLDLADHFWLGPGTVKTLLSNMKSRGAFVRSGEDPPFSPNCDRGVLSSERPQVSLSYAVDALAKMASILFETDEWAVRLKTRGEAHNSMVRMVCMYVFSTVMNTNYSDTGKMFDRDRTTVRHSLQSVEDNRDDDDFDKMIFDLEDAFRNVIYGVALEGDEERRENWLAIKDGPDSWIDQVDDM